MMLLAVAKFMTLIYNNLIKNNLKTSGGTL